MNQVTFGEFVLISSVTTVRKGGAKFTHRRFVSMFLGFKTILQAFLRAFSPAAEYILGWKRNSVVGDSTTSSLFAAVGLGLLQNIIILTSHSRS